jgi:hypothetical protein
VSGDAQAEPLLVNGSLYVSGVGDCKADLVLDGSDMVLEYAAVLLRFYSVSRHIFLPCPYSNNKT